MGPLTRTHYEPLARGLGCGKSGGWPVCWCSSGSGRYGGVEAASGVEVEDGGHEWCFAGDGGEVAGAGVGAVALGVGTGGPRAAGGFTSHAGWLQDGPRALVGEGWDFLLVVLADDVGVEAGGLGFEGEQLVVLVGGDTGVGGDPQGWRVGMKFGMLSEAFIILATKGDGNYDGASQLGEQQLPVSLTTALIPLLGTWSIAVISPVPDFLVVLRASMTQSRRAGVLTAIGVITGIGCWAVAAATGLSVLIDRYEYLYTELRLAGAIFLIGLGLLTLRRAWRESGHQAVREEAGGPSWSRLTSGSTVVHPDVRNWRLGLLTNLANPKALIFFGALFATLLPAGMGTSEKATVLIVMLLMALTWFVGVALMGAAFNAGYRRLSRTIDFVTGGLFVVLGIALAPR